MSAHQDLLKQIDNYNDTVFGLVAFLNECGWSPEAKKMETGFRFGVGRKMETSPSNTISPSAVVTPDLVVQRRKGNGIVAEVKHSWSTSGDWGEYVGQVQKYDDDLLGWWSDDQRLSVPHDLALLVHGSHAVKVSDFVIEGISTKRFSFVRPLVVVGYTRADQTQQFINLRREYGQFSDKTFDERLRTVLPVPMDKVIWKDRRFYDSPPPMPYLLQMLWDDVFDSLAEGLDVAKGKNYVDLRVSADKLAVQLQSFYGFVPDGKRNPGIPRPQWIREALDLLVSVRFAHKEGASYTVHYKRFRGDKLVRFQRACAAAKQTATRHKGARVSRGRRFKPSSEQGHLFE